MTELAWLYDRAGFEKDEAEHTRRLQAAPAPVRKQLVEQHKAQLEAVEEHRLSTARERAKEGLLFYAEHIGSEALQATAGLVGVEIPEDILTVDKPINS